MTTLNTERQEAILKARFAGLTYEQIGKMFGVSRQRIQQVISPPPYIRNIVVEQAYGKCQECGIVVNGSGHVHHGSCMGEDYNDIENLRLLCISCHRIEHAGVYTHHCLRCEGDWNSFNPKPLRCGKCKSPYWNTARIKKGEQADGEHSTT